MAVQREVVARIPVHMALAVVMVDHHNLWADTVHSSLVVVPLATQPS